RGPSARGRARRGGRPRLAHGGRRARHRVGRAGRRGARAAPPRRLTSGLAAPRPTRVRGPRARPCRVLRSVSRRRDAVDHRRARERTVKKLIIEPAQVVAESVEGFGLAHAVLVSVHAVPLFVTRAGGAVSGKVGLVSGGGSGHEPLHAGFVGLGMLDAAVPGAVFTSPTPDQIVPAILGADSGAGVLAIVKNYTGDVLNFETAVELVEAEGTQVSSILVNDDVAVEDSLYTAGRRGVAGTVAVEKIAGAAAERGDDLGTVTEIAGRVVANVRSMGVALTACTVPHVGKPSFDLGDDEVEIGIGIHGEPGRHRIPLAPADEITQRLVDPVADDLGLAEGE